MKTRTSARSFLILAATTALITAPAVHAADLYWDTDGAGALLTDANWASSASGPFSTAWANGSDIFFTANSAITYVTNTAVGNLTITGGSTVTLTAAGTYTTGGAVRTFDIGTGSTLVWNSQAISTAAGTGFIKNGGGTWNLGAQSNLFVGGLTLNAGTIIVGGVNALGGGALNINGGKIHANSTSAVSYAGKLTGITIGGDFALGDTTNTGALTFDAATNLGAADRTITLYSAATFNGVIGGDAGVGLTKAGAGTLTLSGTAVNTFDGGLDVNSGTLALSFANFTSGYSNIINSGNALAFSGGLMTIAGENSAVNTTQTFNGVTVNAGGGSLLVNPNNAGVSNGTTVNLNSLGTLSSWAAGTSLVLGKAVTANTGTVAITTTTDKDATDIYGGRVVFANGTASTGYDWATSTGSGTFTFASYSGYATSWGTSISGGTDTNNSRVEDSGALAITRTLAGNVITNSLKIENIATALAQTLALDVNTLTLTGGGLLSTGTRAYTISGLAGSKLTAGSGNGGTEDLVIHQYNSAASSGATTGLVITAVIGDNTGGVSGNVVNLVKSGINTLALQGANTYSGNTFINAGTLVLGSPGNTSTAGTLGSGNYAGNISIASGAQLAVRSSSTQTLSGVISGDGILYKGGTGTLTLSDKNTYTGTTQVGALAASVGGGTLIVTSFNSVGTGAGYAPRASSSLGAPTTVANGTITVGAGTSSSGTILKYTGPGETTDRNLSFIFNDDLGHLLDASGTGLLKFVGKITSSSGTNASPALTLTGTGSGENAGGIPNFTSNPLRIAKSGTGSWTLSGTNTYTGETQVTVGLLNVTGTLTSNVVVSGTAFLSGTGTTSGTLALGNATTIVGTTVGSSFKAATVAATSAVKIAGSDGSGTIGSHTIGVVRYNTGTGPTTANFSTAGYHTVVAPVVFNDGGAGGETKLTYTNEARTWNSASGTWDAMTATTWQEGDFKFGHGDAVTFNDTGTGGGGARAVTLNSLVTPGSVTFNNTTSTYTVSGTGTIAGLSGLTKSGSGTVTLSTTNTYTGATAVNGGKLVITGSIGNSAVTVTGTDTILATDAAAFFGSTVAVNNGAILAAGDAGAAGTATVSGATTFNNGSVFSWDVAATGTAYDKVVSAGGLVDGNAVGGSVFQIVAADSTFADAFWDSNRTWTDIFTSNTSTAITNWAAIFGSTVSVVNSSFGAITPVGGTFSLSGSTLSWTAIPEPSTALGGLLLTAGLLRRRRHANA